MLQNQERNISIAIAVISGQTLLAVGKLHGLTKQRVAQITRLACLLVNRRDYLGLSEQAHARRAEGNISVISVLRENADSWLRMLNAKLEKISK